MQLLPIKVAEEKEKDNPFFIPMIQLYLKHVTVYLALCDIDITFSDQLYTAVPIKIGVTKKTVDNKGDKTEVTISNVDDSFSAAIFGGYDFRDCKIIIFDIPYPAALTDASQYRIRFIGFLDAPELDLGKATFKADVRPMMPNDFTSGRTLMLSCNNEFADQVSCFANKDLSTGIVQSGSTSNHIYIQQTKPDGYWRNGIITIDHQLRVIKDSVGKRIDVEVGFIGTVEGSYTVERHCTKVYSNCETFEQQTNFTGFLGIPAQYIVKT